MSEREIFVPDLGPPQGPPPSTEVFGIMGQENIFKMLADFYLQLEKSPVRKLFPKNMKKASEKSAAFFVGLLGGPPLYHQQFGHPRMRMRHMPFKIDKQARDIWLKCFFEVLEDAESKYKFPTEHIPAFKNFLERFSLWMVNTK